jgi:hypothetical protein
MTARYWIAPRSTNRAATTAQLEHLGIHPAGFDHSIGAYIGCEMPLHIVEALDSAWGCDFIWGPEEAGHVKVA